MRGFFITVEGCDGAGKSTLVNAMEEYLKESNTSYVRLSMLPQGPIRDIVLSDASLTPLQRAVLIATAGDQAMRDVRKAVDEGKLVLMDRGLDSFYAYQGYGYGLLKEVEVILNSIYTNAVTPDLTLFIDADVELIKKRMADRGEAKDVIESMDDAFHERVYGGFKARMIEDTDLRFYILDANDKPKVMANDACLRLEWLIEAYD